MELYVFDHKMNELKTVLTENEVISAKETKEINKAGELDLCLPVKAYNFQDTDMVLVHTGYENKYHVYVVVSTSLQGDELNVKATEYAYRLMDADGIIHDQRPNDMSVRDVLQHVIIDNGHEGIVGWSVGYVSDDLPNFTGNFYRENRLSALSKLAKACNVEFDFVFTMTGNKIDKRLIEAYDEIGVDTGKRYEYGDNLLSITAETDASGVYTRAYGFGKGEETDSGGFGRRLDFADVEWKKSEGAPIDKPIGWDYLVDTRGNWQDYQLDNGTDPSTVFTFEDCGVENPDDPNSVKEAKEELLWLTWNALQEVNRPKVQFKANIGNAGELNLGDRVQIVRSDADIQYTTRVFKTVRDLITPALTTVELGDKVGTTTGEMVQNIQNQIKDTQESVTNIQNNISFIENNTGNTIYYGEEMPAGDKHKEGDTWFEQHELPGGGMQTTIHVWDGEKWVTTYDPAIFEEAKQAAEDALKKAEESVTKVEGLVSDFENDKVEINNKIDSLDKEVDDRLNGVATKDDVETVRTELNGAIQDKVSSSDFESTRTQLEDAIQDKVSNEEFESSKTQLNDAIQSTVKKVDNLSVGAVNMLQGTQTMFKMKSYKDGRDNILSRLADGYEMFDVGDATVDAEILPNDDIYIKMAEGVDYTQQIRIRTDGILNGVTFTAFADWEHHLIEGKIKKVAQDDYGSDYIAWCTITGFGKDVRVLDMKTINLDGGTYLEFKNPQVEMSSIPSAWGPSPDDFASDEEISQITQTVDGIQLSVKDLKKDTESQLNVLDEAIQATVKHLGTPYPNGRMDGVAGPEGDVLKYYEFSDTPHSVEFNEAKELQYTLFKFDNNQNRSDVYFETPIIEFNEASSDHGLIKLKVKCRNALASDTDAFLLVYGLDDAGNKPNMVYAAPGTSLLWSGVRINIPLSPDGFSEFETPLINIRADGEYTKLFCEIITYGTNGTYGEFAFQELSAESRTETPKIVRNHRVTYVNAGFWGDIKTRGNDVSLGYRNVHDSALNLGTNHTGKDKTSAFLTEYLDCSPNELTKLTFKSKFDYLQNIDINLPSANVYAHFYDGNKVELKNVENYAKYDVLDRWQDNKLTFSDLPAETKYVRFEWVLWGEKETRAIYNIDDVQYSNGETVSSQIAMTHDDLNLAVQGDNLINQINISPEGINIDGSKLHITADTYIDNAVIDSANIKEINGDKVNVVNVRAEHIVGKTSEFVQTAWNGINSSIEITGSHIDIHNGNDPERIYIDRDGIRFTDANYGDMTRGVIMRTDGWGIDFRLLSDSYVRWTITDGTDATFEVGRNHTKWRNQTYLRIFNGGEICFQQQQLSGFGGLPMFTNARSASSGIGFSNNVIVLKDGNWSWL